MPVVSKRTVSCMLPLDRCSRWERLERDWRHWRGLWWSGKVSEFDEKMADRLRQAKPWAAETIEPGSAIDPDAGRRGLSTVQGSPCEIPEFFSIHDGS